MSSDRTLALVHVKHVDVWRGGPSMLDLATQRPLMDAALKGSICRFTKSSPCLKPGDCSDCKHGGTMFCASRLRDAELWWENREREEKRIREPQIAEALSIPRAMWGMIGIGMDRPSDGSRVTQPMRDVMDLSRRRLIVIYGVDGTGKSTAAAMWCWRRKGWYYRATGLRWWTKPGSGWNRDEGEDGRLLKHRAVAIVGLDRPWANKDGPHRHNLLHVLRERFENGLYTLVTSNMGSTDLEPLIGTGLMRTTRNAGAIRQVSEIVDGGEAEAEEGSTF